MQPRSAFVGQNVGRFRRQRSLSVSALARRSGVSKATLLSVELGDANPTIDTLDSIASALDVTLAELVTPAKSHGATVVQRLSESVWNEYDDFRFRALGTLYGPDLVHVLHGHANEVGYYSSGHEAGSVECVFVLSGTLLAGNPDDPIELGVGDWARYPADVPHALRAATGTAENLIIMQRSELSHNLLPVESS